MKTSKQLLVSRSVNASDSHCCILIQTALLTFLLLSGLAVRADTPGAITNETQPFSILSGPWDREGRFTLAWESASNHLYEVQTGEDLSSRTVWVARALMIGGEGATSWSDTNVSAYVCRFFRVHRFSFNRDEDGDGLSNVAEFYLGTDLHKPDSDGVELPTNMIVGQTANLSAFGASGSFTCQWSVVAGKGVFTNTVNFTTDFRPSWRGAVTVQVASAYSGVVCTNRVQTAVAFPQLSPMADWNQPYVQALNNCYNYATDFRSDTFAQPGGGLNQSLLSCSYVTGLASLDGLQPGVDLDRLCQTSGLPEGHIAALLIWPETDFHWVRMEADGMWSHKLGLGPATRSDNAGQSIKDPRTADLGDYQFCGFFWVGPDVEVW